MFVPIKYPQFDIQSLTVDAVITESHVMLPGGMVDRNVVIDDGKIAGLTTGVPTCDSKIDGSGLVSIPGPIDTHVHYGVYSPIDEAARTESHAAAIGGVTTMMRMLRLGVPFSEGLQPQLDASARAHHIDYTIHASVFTQDQIRQMDYCLSKGVSSFKIYMNLGGEVGHVYMEMPPYTTSLQDAKVDVTDHIVESIVRRAAELNCPVLVHAEDYESCACGIKTAKQERRDGLTAWSASRHPKYEAKAIRTVCEYGRRYGCTIYFVHIGSRAALEQIRAERQRGGRIYVESCPHYMVLSHESRGGYLAKVMPPIRTSADNEAVWAAAASGEVDAVGTDHVANRLSSKVGADVWESLAGFPGVGVSIPILLSEGVNRGRISLEQMVRLTSRNAARIFSMYPKKGSLEIGSDADITMLDLKLEQRVRPEIFGGYSDYTVYDGMMLRGWPVRTLVRGEVVAEEFKVISKPGHGRFVARQPGSP